MEINEKLLTPIEIQEITESKDLSDRAKQVLIYYLTSSVEKISQNGIQEKFQFGKIVSGKIYIELMRSSYWEKLSGDLPGSLLYYNNFILDQSREETYSIFEGFLTEIVQKFDENEMDIFYAALRQEWSFFEKFKTIYNSNMLLAVFGNLDDEKWQKNEKTGTHKYFELLNNKDFMPQHGINFKIFSTFQKNDVLAAVRHNFFWADRRNILNSVYAAVRHTIMNRYELNRKENFSKTQKTIEEKIIFNTEEKIEKKLNFDELLLNLRATVNVQKPVREEKMGYMTGFIEECSKNGISFEDLNNSWAKNKTISIFAPLVPPKYVKNKGNYVKMLEVLSRHYDNALAMVFGNLIEPITETPSKLVHSKKKVSNVVSSKSKDDSKKYEKYVSTPEEDAFFDKMWEDLSSRGLKT